MLNSAEPLTITRVTVLNGHTDQQTAHVINDYPYGRTLRCRRRCWIETATDGRAKGTQRFVTQTTNPKVSGEVWNKPKPSTYAPLVVMYLDEDDHIDTWRASTYLYPAMDARARLMGIYDQLTDSDRKLYEFLLRVAQDPRSGGQWANWNATIDAMAEHIRHAGTDPEVVNGTWRDAADTVHSCFDVAPYLITARQRAGVVG